MYNVSPNAEGEWLAVGTLSRLCLYPVKSCAAFSVQRWPLSSKGLLYDREWMVLSQHNSVLSQKQENKLCLVQPSVELESQRLILRAQGHEPVEIPLESLPSASQPGSLVRVCGDR